MTYNSPMSDSTEQVLPDRYPRLMARLLIAMQQVQLADWVEDGMTREPAELVAEMQTQARRTFCRRAR